jgi:phosphoglycolate phosphatase
MKNSDDSPTSFSRQRSSIRTIVFDFDGTLADSIDLLVDITNGFAPEYGFPPLMRENLDAIKDLSPREMMQKYRIPMWQLPCLLWKVRRAIRDRQERVVLYEGIAEAIVDLHARGHQLGIISTNSAENIRSILRRAGIESYFRFIWSSGLFGKRRYLLRARAYFGRGGMVYVGDEVRDVQAARATNIPIVAVEWGFNSKKALDRVDPDYSILSVCELLELPFVFPATSQVGR